MKDTLTLACLNMFGILGALEDLCAFVPQAKALANNGALPGNKPLTVGFTVAGVSAMRLRFADGTCAMSEGSGPCDIHLPFSSAEKFNGMIDGTVTPFPSKGFLKLKFLTRNFIALTKILETYLRASPEALEDKEFFTASTTIMFYLISRAIVQIGNHDKIGRFTASNIPDGTVALAIADDKPLAAAVTIKDHVFSSSRTVPESPHAVMEFSSMELARKLFDGKVSALACVGEGLISMRGNLGILDNVNRLLDRVSAYLG